MQCHHAEPPRGPSLCVLDGGFQDQLCWNLQGSAAPPPVTRWQVVAAPVQRTCIAGSTCAPPSGSPVHICSHRKAYRMLPAWKHCIHLSCGDNRVHPIRSPCSSVHSKLRPLSRRESTIRLRQRERRCLVHNDCLAMLSAMPSSYVHASIPSGDASHTLLSCSLPLLVQLSAASCGHHWT